LKLNTGEEDETHRPPRDTDQLRQARLPQLVVTFFYMDRVGCNPKFVIFPV
jgi:hypothetical protein